MRNGLILCAFALVAAVGVAQAADFPTKPIRVIVATSPGGTSDIFVRALGQEFQKRTGEGFIVENRSGGGLNIGGEDCARAANDGYTICILPNETLIWNRYLYKSLPFNPAKDFRPITNPFFNTQVIVASSKLHAKSMDELAAVSKAKPGTLSYSALSVPLQIFMEEWKKKTGADIVFVPTRGGGRCRNGGPLRHDPRRDRRHPQLVALHSQRYGASSSCKFRSAIPASARRAYIEGIGLLTSISDVFRTGGSGGDTFKRHRYAVPPIRGDQRRARLPEEAIDRARLGSDFQYSIRVQRLSFYRCRASEGAL